MMRMLRGPAPILIAALALLANATNVTVSNTQLRRTRLGNVVVAQDGNICNAKSNGEFVLVGMSYGGCIYDGCQNQTLGSCGFGAGRILVWTSPTLGDGSWSEPVEILPASQRPGNAIYFRPHVVWNERTKLWVLWVRYEAVRGPRLSDDPTGYLTATSPSLRGPWTVAQANVTMHFANSADDNLFVDDDGTGYIVHTARATGMKVVVERLSSDFTTCRGASSSNDRSELIGPGGTEAPALFKHNGVYFVTLAKECCYCTAGAATIAFFSRSGPLGPYEPAGSLGNTPGAQQNFVVADSALLGHGQVLWSGNRWGSDPVNNPAVFDNSLQYWGLMSFASNGTSVLQMVWQDEIELVI